MLPTKLSHQPLLFFFLLSPNDMGINWWGFSSPLLLLWCGCWMSPWKCLCYMLSTPVVMLRWGPVGYPLTRGTVLPSRCYFRSHPFSAFLRGIWYFLPQCSATCCGALACAVLFGIRASKTVNLINFFIIKLAWVIYFIVMIFKTDQHVPTFRTQTEMRNNMSRPVY